MDMPAKQKVLVVDDDPVILDVIKQLLAKTDFECDTALNGLEALNLSKLHIYSAIITDVVMPKLNGLQLTRELIGLQIDAPIMVMTGYGGENAEADAMAAGANEFLEKPFSPAEFDLRFQKMMQQHELVRLSQKQQDDLHRISTSMIAGLQKDAYENLTRLQKKLDELHAKKKAL